MVLMGAASASGCAAAVRPEVLGATTARGSSSGASSSSSSFCEGTTSVLPTTFGDQDLLGRADLKAARARATAAARALDMAIATDPHRRGLSVMLGLTSLGLNNLVRTGSDIGQAALGYWTPPSERRPASPAQSARAELDAAEAAYRSLLPHARREVADADAEAHVLAGRIDRGAANLADAQAALATLRRRRAAGEAADDDLLRVEVEVALRADRLAALRTRGLATRAALVQAVGCGPADDATAGRREGGG